ncbi:MAG TPA: 5'-nucleotidase C-terminal domain-containing protein [Chitinophagaceae bacterium]|nr:5'-nucleotidase C-terminal domain-containing protein [Chitinophagaceae bacterium]
MVYLVSAAQGVVKAQKMYNCTIGTHLYELKAGAIAKDTPVFNLLSIYKDSMQLKMEEVIVTNEAPLSKTQPESTLGNWISDAAKNQASRLGLQADICLFSYGCIGKDYLAPGPIRRKDVYELIPFDNKMILVSLSGIALQHLCDSIVRVNGLPLAGLSFTIDSGRATQIRVGQSALHEYRVYTILLNDYLLSRYRELLGKLRYRSRSTGLLLRNLLIEECRERYEKGIPVHAVLEKRITYAD